MRVLSTYKGDLVSYEGCEELCSDYKYFGRQGFGECWCGNILTSAQDAPLQNCNCEGNYLRSLKQCIYEKIPLISIEKNTTGNLAFEGEAKINFGIDKFPEYIDGIATVNFCILTSLQISRWTMDYLKTPFSSVFSYDGRFSITQPASLGSIGDGQGAKIVYSTVAFICNPHTFTEKTGRLAIGSILHVCIRPKENQRDIVIDDILFFKLDQDTQDTFHAITKKILSPLTVVTGRGTRRAIISTRLPAYFFETDSDVNGLGEVILSSRYNQRFLHSKIDVSRDLQEDLDNSFVLNIKVEIDKPTLAEILEESLKKNMPLVLIIIFVGLLCIIIIIFMKSCQCACGCFRNSIKDTEEESYYA